LAHQPIALRTKFIDLGQHPGQQFFRRSRAYTGSLQGLNLFALPVDLAAHMFDFGSDGF
jgi:hypothetical protein